MLKANRTAITASLVTAALCLLAVTAFATASNNDDASIAAKRALTRKQTKAVNKLINKAVKKALATSEAKIVAAEAKIAAAEAKQAHVGHASFYASNSADVAIASNYSIDTTVLTKSLPAGKHVVNARVYTSFEADDEGDQFAVRCQATDGTNTLDAVDHTTRADQALIFVGWDGHASLPLNFVVDSTTGMTITISCDAGYDSPGARAGLVAPAGKTRLNAVQVSSVG